MDELQPRDLTETESALAHEHARALPAAPEYPLPSPGERRPPSDVPSFG